MFVIDEGEGRCVLLLHGAPSGIDIFDGLRCRLASSYRVLTPELPGYGRSQPLAAGLAFPQVREALEAMLRERQIDRLSLVGFSAGAYRALEIALAGVVAVDHLVLLGAVADIPAESRQQFRELAALVRGGFDARDLMPPRMLAPAFAAERPDLVERVRRWALVAPAANLASELEALAEIEDLRPRLSTLRCKTLIRAGALDVATPATRARELACMIPGAVFEEVPHAGHTLLFEDYEATTSSIETFLRA